MSDNIPPLTVQQLFIKLREVGREWYSLGVVLGVPVRKLQEIQASDSQGGVQHWKINMFQCWLDSTPSASWKDLIMALEQINHVALATKLKEEIFARRVEFSGNSEEELRAGECLTELHVQQAAYNVQGSTVGPLISVSEALKKYLTCPICREHFQQPRTLPCLHSFCFDCLQQLLLVTHGASHFITCHSCRKPTPLFNKGLTNLPVAFHINILLDFLKQLQVYDSQQTSCDNCHRVQATSYCKQCRRFLCQGCVNNYHKGWEPFSHHELTGIEVIPPREPPIMNCHDHTKALNIHCETCDQLICQHCIIKLHRDHNYDVVINPKHKQRIKIELQIVEQQLSMALKDLKEMTDQIQGQEVEQQIHTTMQQAIKDLQELESQLKKKDWINDSNSLNIMITGLTGSGKSSFINGLVGEEAREEGNGLDSMTMDVEAKTMFLDRAEVTIWDTPGLMAQMNETSDVLDKNEEDRCLGKMKQCCSDCHLYIYCVNMSQERFVTEIRPMQRLTVAFGREFWKRVLFVLTFANTEETRCPINDYNPTEWFVDRVELWRNSLSKILTVNCRVEQEVANGIVVIPAGSSRPRGSKGNPWVLPGIENWLHNFWDKCASTIDHLAFPALFKANKRKANRFRETREINGELNSLPIKEQPMPIYSDKIRMTGFGLGGAAAGLGIGYYVATVIGVLTGPAGATVGAFAFGVLSVYMSYKLKSSNQAAKGNRLNLHLHDHV